MKKSEFLALSATAAALFAEQHPEYFEDEVKAEPSPPTPADVQPANEEAAAAADEVPTPAPTRAADEESPSQRRARFPGSLPRACRGGRW